MIKDDFDIWVAGPIAQALILDLNDDISETKSSLHALSEQKFKPEHADAFLELQLRLSTLIEIKENILEGYFIKSEEDKYVR